MKFYPLYLNITGEKCVVIGGGKVAERKVESLRNANARISVISPTITKNLKKLAHNNTIEYRKRQYRRGDLKNAKLAFGTTGSKNLNERIREDALHEGVLFNATDDVRQCDFIVPSILKRGGLQIAVSTSGMSPALAVKIRKELSEKYGKEYRILAGILGDIRRKIKFKEEKISRAKFQKLLNSNILSLIEQKRFKEIDKRIGTIFGKEFSNEKGK